MVFERVQGNVLRTQSLHQQSISLQGVGLIVLIGVDPTNIEFGNEFEENVMGGSVGHIDVRTLGLCFFLKDRHAVVQEGHPGVLFVLQVLQNVFVKNEEQQHAMTRGQGCMEGTVVVPTKVPAEPMDDQRRRGKGKSLKLVLSGKETAHLRGPSFWSKTWSKTPYDFVNLMNPQVQNHP